MREAVIVSGARTAVGRAPRGALRAMHPVDMAAAAIREAVDRAEGLEPTEVEDVIIGCAMPEGTQGNNMARLASLRAGMPEHVPAQTVNRFCSSGLRPSRTRPRGSWWATQGRSSPAAASTCPPPSRCLTSPQAPRSSRPTQLCTWGWASRRSRSRGSSTSRARTRTSSRCAATTAPRRPSTAGGSTRR